VTELPRNAGGKVLRTVLRDTVGSSLKVVDRQE
jgi:acyl-coenzyme A synthetase/AMP-(fatty) acid ligase